ncbi:MAG: DUF4345 family protein [Deltaproteobacteria bacterium]|nr:DUF4345 family protein [Deltaproteobacteria bacterium]
MAFSRIILAFTGCMFAVYGLMCLWDPATPAGYAGMELAQTSASTEVIAMYGGLQIGLGALLVAWAWQPHRVVPALVVILFCVGGLALGRSTGLLRNGTDVYNLGAVGYEATTAILAAIALQLERRYQIDTGTAASQS